MGKASEGTTTVRLVRLVAGSRAPNRVLQRVAKGFARWVEIQCRRAALADELYRLDDRAMADMDLQRSDIPLVVRSYPDTTDLLRRMMRRIGLDFETLRKQPAVMRRLERACVTCWSRRDCRWWLQSGGARDGYRVFCPNTENFDSLRLQRRMGVPLSLR